MSIYHVRRQTQAWYGESVGILILDASYPCVPGNVGNANTFNFPVRYEKVTGATIDRLLNQRDPALAQLFIDAARRLEDAGVKAITGACGFMALFQREVAAAVEIPVFLSSLLQLPFIHALTGRPVGVVTADSRALVDVHFRALGIERQMPYFIAGMEAQEEFRTAVLLEKGTLNDAAIRAEVVEVAAALVRENPEIGSILLECSDLPPYAAAINQALGLPVFDFISMINYAQRALSPPEYRGFL